MTSRQAEIVNTILRYQREHEKLPSLKELVTAMGLRSTGSLGHNIAILRATGHLAPNVLHEARALRVLKPAYDVIYRCPGTELHLAPLGKARMAGVWDG